MKRPSLAMFTLLLWCGSAVAELSPAARTVRSLMFSRTPGVFFDGVNGRTSDATQLSPEILQRSGLTAQQFRAAIEELKLSDPAIRQMLANGEAVRAEEAEAVDEKTRASMKETSLATNPAAVVRASFEAFLQSSRKLKDGTIPRVEAERRARDSTAATMSTYSEEVSAGQIYAKGGGSPEDAPKPTPGTSFMAKTVDWSDADVRKVRGRNERRHENDPDLKNGNKDDPTLFDDWRALQVKKLAVMRAQYFRAALLVRSRLGESLHLSAEGRIRLTPKLLEGLEFQGRRDGDGKWRMTTKFEGREWSVSNEEGEIRPGEGSKPGRLAVQKETSAYSLLHALEQSAATIDDLEKTLNGIESKRRPENMPKILGEKLLKLSQQHAEEASTLSMLKKTGERQLGDDFELLLWDGRGKRPDHWQQRSKEYAFNLMSVDLRHAASGKGLRKNFTKFMAPFIFSTGFFMGGVRVAHDVGWLDPTYKALRDGADWTVEKIEDGFGLISHGWDVSWNWAFLPSPAPPSKPDFDWMRDIVDGVPPEEKSWVGDWAKDLSAEDLKELKDMFDKNDSEQLKENQGLLRKIEPKDLPHYQRLFSQLDQQLSSEERQGNVLDTGREHTRNVIENIVRSMPESKDRLKELLPSLRPTSIARLNALLTHLTPESLEKLQRRLKGLNEGRERGLRGVVQGLTEQTLDRFKSEFGKLSDDTLAEWNQVKTAAGAKGPGGANRKSSGSSGDGPPGVGQSNDFASGPPILPTIHRDGGNDPSGRNVVVYRTTAGPSVDLLYLADNDDLKPEGLRSMGVSNGSFEMSIEAKVPHPVQGDVVAVPMAPGMYLANLHAETPDGRKLEPGKDFEFLRTPRGIPVLKIKNPEVTSVLFSAGYGKSSRGDGRFSVFFDPDGMSEVVAKLRQAKFHTIAKRLEEAAREAKTKDEYLLLSDVERIVEDSSLYTYHPASSPRDDVPDDNEFKPLTGMQDERNEFCTQCTGSAEMLKQIHSIYRLSNPSLMNFAVVPALVGKSGSFSKPGHAVFAGYDSFWQEMRHWDATPGKFDPRAPTPEKYDEELRKRLADTVDKAGQRKGRLPPPGERGNRGSSAASSDFTSGDSGGDDGALQSADMKSNEEASAPTHGDPRAGESSRAGDPSVHTQTAGAETSPVSKEALPPSTLPASKAVSSVPDFIPVVDDPGVLEMERRLVKTFANRQRRPPLPTPRGIPAAGAPPDPDRPLIGPSQKGDAVAEKDTELPAEEMRSEQVPSVAEEKVETEERAVLIADEALIRELRESVEGVFSHPWFNRFRREMARDRSLPVNAALRAARALEEYARDADIEKLAALLEPLLPPENAMQIRKPADIPIAVARIKDVVEAKGAAAAQRASNPSHRSMTPSQADEGFVGRAVKILELASTRDFTPKTELVRVPVHCAEALARVGAASE